MNTEPTRRRPTIALPIDFIGDMEKGPAWLGVVSAAREADVNLMSFVGYRIDATRFSPSRNHVYRLMNRQNVDGVVVNPSMLSDEPDRVRELLHELALPTVTFGSELEGYPGVHPELSDCFRQALEHLISAHGRRRIALLIENARWKISRQRQDIYREVMQQAGLDVPERLILTGTTERKQAGEAVAQLFEGRMEPPDAIFTATDRVADQVLEELKTRNLQVPEDVAVISGQDIEVSRYLDPTLTTVQVPMADMAAAAVRQLADWLRTGTQPQSSAWPCSLKLRHSCGCVKTSPELERLTIAIQTSGTLAESLQEQRDELVSGIRRLSERLGGVREPLVENTEDVVDRFLQAIRDKHMQPFSGFLNDLIRNAGGQEEAAWYWVKVLASLLRQVNQFPRDAEGKAFATEVLLHGLDVLHDFAWRTNRASRLAQFMARRRQRGLGQELIRSLDINRIHQTAAQIAADADIERLCACVYAQSGWPSVAARVYMATRNGTPEAFTPGSLVVRSHDLPPPMLYDTAERFSVLVAPMDYEEMGGFVVMDQTSRDWRTYPELASNIAAALRETLRSRTMREQATRLADLNERLNREVAQRRQAQEKLTFMALHDPLTALPNRSLFLDRVEHAARRTRRSEHPSFGVIFLDLDHFKDVNDTLGHSAGDRLLKAVAARLQRCIRPGDTIARIGGDEFTILVENLKHPDEAEHIAQRIHQALGRPITVDGQNVKSGTSIGIALSRADGNAEEIIKDADEAMYQAKVGGRGRTCVLGRPAA
jgi:diguanylate cyclase (GGDEF)-like protein